MMPARSARHAVRFARVVRESGRGGSTLGQRVLALPRMIRAVRSGEYPGLTPTRLMLILAGAGYVFSPVDLVPEGLLMVFGLVDDLLVVGWVATELLRETDEFLAWERTRAVVVPGHAVHTAGVHRPRRS